MSNILTPLLDLLDAEQNLITTIVLSVERKLHMHKSLEIDIDVINLKRFSWKKCIKYYEYNKCIKNSYYIWNLLATYVVSPDLAQPLVNYPPRPNRESLIRIWFWWTTWNWLWDERMLRTTSIRVWNGVPFRVKKLNKKSFDFYTLWKSRTRSDVKGIFRGWWGGISIYWFLLNYDMDINFRKIEEKNHRMMMNKIG